MHRRILVALVAGLTAIAGAAVLPTAPVSAGAGGGVAVVNTEADGPDEDTADGVCEITDGAEDCSLRAALDTAQALGGLWDISVPAGDYLLDDELFYFNVEAVVTGAGVAETVIRVDASEGVTRHLDLSVDGTIDLTLTDMTFTDGLEADGGSIRARGGADLTIERVHFLENTARDSGGAISVAGGGATLVVEDTTFIDNVAGQLGGAVHVTEGESATITNSTFTGNNAGFGGALFVGEADLGSPGSATLTHVTLADNSASGMQGDPMGGAIGVGSEGSLDLTGTIIERSVEGPEFVSPAALGDPIANCFFAEGATVVSGGFNVVDDATCEVTEGTDQADTAAGTAALADNGGPTFTMALDAASPAVDEAGDTCSVSDDQRGVARPQDGNNDGTTGCDSGAFELQATPPVPPGPPPVVAPPAARPVQASPSFTG